MAASFVRSGRKIVAIGRNYADHIKELNNATPKEPFFFLKPTTSYAPSGRSLEIPRGVLAHYEVELGVVIGKTARDVQSADADQYIAGYALAVDVTARNVQDAVKKKGLPWSTAKGFDTFTPIGDFIPKRQVPDYNNLALKLKIGETIKQDGNTQDMLFKIPQLLQHVTSIMSLEEGDLLLTGTPSGVGEVKPGDKVECTLEDDGKLLSRLVFDAVQRQGGYHFKE